MPSREPLNVAFVWHMHQPYYRTTPAGPFQMPWARLHALKGYGPMVEILEDYPDLHQTYNLVPSLVEQLESYASGRFADTYWDLTLKPAEELSPPERAFVVERMCEGSSHPRAAIHPRYMELAQKRDANASFGWGTCSLAFTAQEIRDLQVWFNLAWFPPVALESEPLSELVAKGQGFTEADKQILAETQARRLSQVLPLYREAENRGQVEISTSPYFHPILPLLLNSDSARIATADVILPSRRFAHPEDAREQIELGIAKHVATFGHPPRGIWCPEQAVGEEVLPLLIRAGISWTVADELVLARSLSGTSHPRRESFSGRPLSPSDTPALDSPQPTQRPPAASSAFDQAMTTLGSTWGSRPSAAPTLYDAYRLPREEGELCMVFRDHTLSDLIGFSYQAWNPRDAARDLWQRLKTIALRDEARLVTIALDGENPWDHYQRNGQDFLRFLYEALSSDPSLRCVTVSEHLQEQPPTRVLPWLHTGSWVGADLRTWIGDPAHNLAWDLLHDARDMVARRRESRGRVPPQKPEVRADSDHALDSAWHHILVAEGSDWFWWFGRHHHTELDYVWDHTFRQHLLEAYRSLGEQPPTRLFFPILEQEDLLQPVAPRGPVRAVIDGRLSPEEGWELAGRLAEETTSTMGRGGPRLVEEVRFALDQHALHLLLVPSEVRFFCSFLDKLSVRVLARSGSGGASVDLLVPLKGETAGVLLACEEVVELSVPYPGISLPELSSLSLELHVEDQPDALQSFHSRGLAGLGPVE